MAEPRDVLHMMNDQFQAYLESKSEGEQSAHFHRLEGLMRAYAARIVYTTLRESSKDLVDESVQKTTMKLYQFQGHSLFSSWYTSIINHVCMDYLREKKLRGVEVDPQTVENELQSTPNPDAKLTFEHIKKLLSPADRQLLDYKLHGYTESEIAQKMGGWCQSAVSVRWLRLKRKVREECPEVFVA